MNVDGVQVVQNLFDGKCFELEASFLLDSFDVLFLDLERIKGQESDKVPDFGHFD